MKFNQLAILCGVALLSLTATSVVGQTLSGGQPSRTEYIQSVIIQGNSRVSDEKIQRVLRLRRGDRLEPEKVEDALKRLYDTRQFNDIQAWRNSVGRDSVSVTFIVSEYPMADDVRIVGNDKLSLDDLKPATTVTKGSFIRPALVDRDRDALVEVYKEKGYYGAAVTDTIVASPGGNVLTYRIVEGAKVSIRNIDFVGIRALESVELRSVMELNTASWWKGADFKSGELEADKTRVVELYRSEGFLDAEVGEVELVFSEDGRDLDVFFHVSEGKRYYTGDVTWSGNELFPDSVIARVVQMEKGIPFDDIALGRIQYDLGNMYWDRGYIYSGVTPVKTVHRDTVDVVLSIAQGNLAHVNEINIVGNTKTAEWVIRRELVIRPGDVFTASRLRRSLREVFNLGFFAGPPTPNFVPANEDGDVDLTLRVQEKPAGQFRMGAGFSQLNRVSGFIGVSEPNFLGRGIRVSFDWEFSRYRQNINIGMTEPWFRGTPTRLSFNVYSQNQNQVRQQFFSDRRTGFSVSLGRPFPWLDYTTLSGRYSLEQVELSDFSPGYTGSLRFTDWPQTTSTVGMTMLRNSTDNPFHPTTGTRFLFDARWTGGIFGGDVTFQRYETEFSWYQHLIGPFVFEFKTNLGVLDGYDNQNNVPDYEKFRLGGNRRYGMRGYDFYEIFPAGNAPFVGGRFYSVFGYEISFPVVPPTVYGLFFFDTGNTWNSFQEADLTNLRRGAGLGIRIELPMLGTVGLDYGYGFDRFGGGAWEPHITFGGGF